MTPDLLNPPEAWDAAEEQIELWREDRDSKRRAMWKMQNGW